MLLQLPNASKLIRLELIKTTRSLRYVIASKISWK